MPFLKDKLTNYANSSEFGKPLAFTQNTYEQFILTTIKNVNIDENNYGFIVIQENANEIRVAIMHQQNARAIGTDHTPPELFKICHIWYGKLLKKLYKYPNTVSLSN